MSAQLCIRCGRHEQSGAFCSYCRTAEYDLVDHSHAKEEGSGCPFGARLDPLNTNPTDIARFLAKPPSARLVGIPVRHHPRTPGYTPDTDPPIPSWIPRPDRPQRQPRAQRPEVVSESTSPEQLALSPQA